METSVVISYSAEASAAVIIVPSYTESTQQRVIREFGENHIMVEIARCESFYRQFDTDGKVLYSYLGTPDVGIFQINETYHLSQSTKMGFDIYTIEGNVAYARNLYEREGTRPWNASKHCWSKQKTA